MRQKARRLVNSEKPKLLIGSPPCTMYSQLQALMMERRDPKEIQRLMVQANTHLLFCIYLYRLQPTRGGYFPHEHVAPVPPLVGLKNAESPTNEEWVWKGGWYSMVPMCRLP